jgi:uncharacterized protein YacL
MTSAGPDDAASNDGQDGPASEQLRPAHPAGLALFRSGFGFFVLVLTAVGVYLGGPLGDWLSWKIAARFQLEVGDLLLFKIGIRVIAGLVAFLVAVKLFNWLVQSVEYLESMSLLDKAAAAIGVLLGLTVALLASFPFGNVAQFGTAIRLLSILCFVPLGIFFALSAKDQMVYVFPALGTPPMNKGAHALREGAKLLDTNIIIDGRIADIAAAGFLEGLILVPGFVLKELRAIADSADEVKRARGKRGLEVLNRLQSLPNVQVVIYEDYPEDDDPREEVDVRLVRLARVRNAAVVTNDHGVAQLARLHGTRVLNVNELAQALRPAYLPGEEFVVTIVKEGKEPGQGVGYLDDGTMVVVEAANKHLGRAVAVVVTSSLQTSAGKMIFADLNTGQAAPRSRPTAGGARRGSQ